MNVRGQIGNVEFQHSSSNSGIKRRHLMELMTCNKTYYAGASGSRLVCYSSIDISKHQYRHNAINKFDERMVALISGNYRVTFRTINVNVDAPAL